MRVTNQLNQNECGICVIKSLIKHFHYEDISKQELLNNCSLTDEGLSLLEFELILEKYGILVDSFEANFAEILDIKNKTFFVTIIKKNNANHFIIVQKNQNNFIIFDSDCGKYEISEKEFSKIFLNIFITLKKGKFLANLENKNLLTEKINWKYLISINLINVFLILVSLFSATFLQTIICKVINNQNLSILFSIVTIYLISFMVNIIGEWFINLYTLNKSIKFYKFLNYYVMKLLQNKKDSFYIKTDYNFLLQKNEHIFTLSTFYTTTLNNFISDILIIFFSSIIILSLNYWLFLFLLILILINLFINYLKYQYSKKIILKQVKLENNFNYFYLKFLKNNMKNKNSYQNKIFDHEIFKNDLEIFELFNQSAKFSGFINVITNFFKMLFFILIISVSCSIIFKKNSGFSIGNLTFLIILIERILGSSDQMFNIFSQKTTFKVSKEIVENFLYLDNNKNHFGINDLIVKHIKVQDLTLNYKNNNLFDKLKLNIKNDTVLYGKSGVGKTTLLKIIINNSDYEKFIYLNNVSKNFINSNWIKENLLYISDEPIFIEKQISELLQTDKQKLIIAVLQKFQINYFQENNLSQGQLQIVNLLLLLRFKNKVLVLDEPLSNVDTQTKKELIEILKPTLIANNFVIWATHDLQIENYFSNKLVL